MSYTLKHAFSHSLTLLASFSILLVVPSSCFNPKKIVNASIHSYSSDGSWSSAVATWYGPSHGDGSEGGACGYGRTVGEPPFSSMIAAGSRPLFDSGKGCGSCYEVKCTGNKACSGNPVRVVITDNCPDCGSDAHFDMSGAAFGQMAVSGQADQLRNVGRIAIQYNRVACNYGRSIVFHVDSGSNQDYLAVMVEYEDGDGELERVEVKEASSESWEAMEKSWGAVWKYNKRSQLKAPFSIRLTNFESKTIEASNVIPAGWTPGSSYVSNVNF
ncbi:putative expansin-B2 [Vigna angularis]|uniref:Expansin-like EG45 domain-containing protein n=2 Tax=Phaseolus angularis TaxID=3914 RepID=A0A0S3STJ8_PHAAN|nr:putative expansin-B2 [Vigna angularis]KAG2403222.1 putative expansin-B2 [Vigna angularis]BAT96168.1 hypothetical protein VIGAN_08306000 [Vigna angularis var. angularis]